MANVCNYCKAANLECTLHNRTPSLDRSKGLIANVWQTSLHLAARYLPLLYFNGSQDLPDWTALIVMIAIVAAGEWVGTAAKLCRPADPMPAESAGLRPEHTGSISSGN